MSDPVTTLQLRNLPPYAKTFVGIFTALILCVCVWAVWIYSVRYGSVDPQNLPAYLQKRELKADIEELKNDSNAVIAPVWNDSQAGQERPVDSATLEALKRQPVQGRDEAGNGYDPNEDLGLAHTHVNGQTLLFFAMGLIFLITSATPRIKTTIYVVFGVCILSHNLGLSFRSRLGVFDDMLAISGILILLTIAYMAFIIFSDLAKKPTGN